MKEFALSVTNAKKIVPTVHNHTSNTNQYNNLTIKSLFHLNGKWKTLQNNNSIIPVNHNTFSTLYIT